ncbi:hypothetical protein METHB2_410004 [Candidatus Methylobacter favarea]|uniref:Uncharacterized protein n=1 Tax=Candidatus Methylobacter favarea TaxID=2707345 RepID=A0A8S0X1V8_9GAMM|nr:hypothetical protein METHB2_410004 [Candidatus Methylobacter favarea]
MTFRVVFGSARMPQRIYTRSEDRRTGQPKNMMTYKILPHITNYDKTSGMREDYANRGLQQGNEHEAAEENNCQRHVPAL